MMQHKEERYLSILLRITISPLLLILLLLLLLLLLQQPNVVVASPHDEESLHRFDKDQVLAFARKHYESYMTDCDYYTNHFADSFEYCEIMACHSGKAALESLCQINRGTKVKIHSWNAIPAAFPNPLHPAWNHFVVKGLQTVWLPDAANMMEFITQPDLERVPTCYDFVTELKVQRCEKTNENPEGMEVAVWRSFWTRTKGLCPATEGAAASAQEKEEHKKEPEL